MLDRVHPLAPQRRLVEDGQVPDIQVQGPDRKGDGRMGEHGSRSNNRIFRIGCSIGPVTPSTSRSAPIDELGRQ